jgi:hypothetical protein
MAMEAAVRTPARPLRAAKALRVQIGVVSRLRRGERPKQEIEKARFCCARARNSGSASSSQRDHYARDAADSNEIHCGIQASNKNYDKGFAG